MGHSEVVGYFETSKKLLRINLASFEVVRETDNFYGEIVKINVAYFNHRFILIGYRDGRVEVRDTETLEK